MPTLLIGYDLNRPGQNYPDLIERIKSLGAWWHYLDSTWLVDTSYSPTDVRDVLKGLIDQGDELLVIDVSGRTWSSYGLNDDATAWLKQHVAA